jgi:glycosyltransferase involved in cell wall biosynthesis
MNSSFIITLYNEAGNISRFLESYKEQTIHCDDFIILDGGSTDKTADIIQKFSEKNPDLKIRLIIDENCSRRMCSGPIAKGRNTAIKESRYDIIIISDGGCILDSKYVEEMLRTFEEGGCDVVSGWYKPIVDNKFNEIFAQVSLPSEEDALKESFLPSSRSLALKKSCWEAVGGYPEDTFTGEDTLFDLNLKKAGFKFKTNLNAFVYWETPGSLSEGMKKQFSYGKGDGTLGTFKLRYILRWLTLLCPLHILMNRRRRKHPLISYSLQLAYQHGYTKGLLC